MLNPEQQPLSPELHKPTNESIDNSYSLSEEDILRILNDLKANLPDSEEFAEEIFIAIKSFDHHPGLAIPSYRAQWLLEGLLVHVSQLLEQINDQ